MKSNFTTVILFFVLIILLLGIIVLGGAMYLNLIGDDTSQVISKIENIVAEKPNETSDNKTSTKELIQGSLTTNSQEQQTVIADNNSINNYFYKQLKGNQKIIYDKLNENKQNLRKGNYKIEFGETFSDILSMENGKEELGKDYQTGIEAFMHDNPDLFYLDINKMYLNIETTTKFFRTTHNVYISAAKEPTYLSNDFSTTEQVETAIVELENIKNEVMNSLRGTDYQKILYIHDYLINNIEYDSTYQAKGSYSVYGALIMKKCVCEGYAKAFKYLTNAAGIECEIMQGTATNSSGQTESHAWNCIKVNNIWYEVDTTWDDPIVIGGTGKVSNQVRYRYFLKGSNTFDKDHVASYQFSEGGKEFYYPIINKNDY